MILIKQIASKKLPKKAPHIRGTFLDLACNPYRIKLRTSPQVNFLKAYDLSTKQSATESKQSPFLLSRYD